MPSSTVYGLFNATATRLQVTNTSSRWYCALLWSFLFSGLTTTEKQGYLGALNIWLGDISNQNRHPCSKTVLPRNLGFPVFRKGVCGP
ncbi:hypothetical protein ARMSODRAFT_620062 [Armillaria solidipes]|uniref:Uncharacterized protein n=1 Tax=Armillaria solidipes TaxID=1076256 RepID=A0A2H3ASM2_9AGAR|nr:hypothetical protein ARMSODRAFT_620062 [Armillaria solidipes]